VHLPLVLQLPLQHSVPAVQEAPFGLSVQGGGGGGPSGGGGGGGGDGGAGPHTPAVTEPHTGVAPLQGRQVAPPVPQAASASPRRHMPFSSQQPSGQLVAVQASTHLHWPTSKTSPAWQAVEVQVPLQKTSPAFGQSHEQVCKLTTRPRSQVMGSMHLPLSHVCNPTASLHTHSPRSFLICPAWSQPVPPGFRLALGTLPGAARAIPAGPATSAPPNREAANTRSALRREMAPVPSPRARSSKRCSAVEFSPFLCPLCSTDIAPFPSSSSPSSSSVAPFPCLSHLVPKTKKRLTRGLVDLT
jgi:hypothetical protein